MKWRLNKCTNKYTIDVFSDDYSSYITLYDEEGEIFYEKVYYKKR